METRLYKNIRRNMESMQTEQLLKIYVENDRNSYSDEALSIIRELLIERQIDLPAQKKYKYCPNCMIENEINQKICKCGYNYIQPNLDDMTLVKNKRKRKNRINGILLILFGIGASLYWLPDYSPQNYNSQNQINRLLLGIPPLMILIGLYKIVFGAAAKTPTGSPFDHILGDKNAKEEEDVMDFILCPSCGKQLFKEMDYKKCPKCNSKIT